MSKIRVAIAGLGNCASSLIQGIHWYADAAASDGVGLAHPVLGGYQPGDIWAMSELEIGEPLDLTDASGQHFVVRVS